MLHSQGSRLFPHIHYCLTAWAGCNLTQRKRIQKVINYGARIVSGQLLREYISPTLQALGWSRFEEVIETRDLVMAKRLLSDTAPPALAATLTRRAQVAVRETRGTRADMLELPRIRTEAARRTFPYRAVLTWNRHGAASH